MDRELPMSRNGAGTLISRDPLSTPISDTSMPISDTSMPISDTSMVCPWFVHAPCLFQNAFASQRIED